MQFLTTVFAATALVSSVFAAPAAEVSTLEARTLYGAGPSKQYGFRCNAPGKPVHGKWIKPDLYGVWGIVDDISVDASVTLSLNVDLYGVIGFGGSKYPQCMKSDSYGHGHGLIPTLAVDLDVAIGVGANVGLEAGKWLVTPAFPALDILDIFGTKHWFTWNDGCKTCTWKCHQDKSGKWGFTWWDNQEDFGLLHVDIAVFFDVSIEIVKKAWWTLPFTGYSGLPIGGYGSPIPIGGGYSGSPSGGY